MAQIHLNLSLIHISYKIPYHKVQSNEKIYTRYYSGFIGTDFSNTGVDINPKRSPYCINMYNDYQDEKGTATKTRPGIEKVTKMFNRVTMKGKFLMIPFMDKVLIRAGEYLIEWIDVYKRQW